MLVPKEWLDRIKSLSGASRKDELHQLALQCLRLTLPLLEDKLKLQQVIAIGETCGVLRECTAAGMDAQEANGVLTARGLMTEAELRAACREASILIRLATDADAALSFATIATGQLAAFLDAHMERALGNDEAYRAAAAKFNAFYRAGGKSPSLLDVEFPEAAKALTGLLNGPARAKTLDRLAIFRSFTVHQSFRQVARQADEAAETPDHSGPAYKVRKLGESLGVQLTRLSPEPGRSRTELTPAGHALADWVSSRPDLPI